MRSQKKRCSWCEGDQQYVDYHDTEWGVKEVDSLKLFEMFSLEMMQAGLSWITVLRKREHMRETFFNFDPVRLCESKEQRIVEKWMENPRIIRHRGKLEALITNARLYIELGNFGDLLWRYVPEQNIKKKKIMPTFTDESVSMATELKKLGFKFVGPTSCYSLMQSCGMVNDHHPDCWRYRHCI